MNGGQVTTLARHTTVVGTTRLASGSAIAAIAVGSALLRLAFVHVDLSPDEAGFTIVARQWAPGGSLYGGYWVDRPPLLIELFRVGSEIGGAAGAALGLRLVGCVAAFAATLAVGFAARAIAGPRAAAWAALMAGAGLASPLLGAVPVNGELLAAPFVAASVWCWTLAIRARRHPRLLMAAGAGAGAAAAVMVKQNMLDGAVFAAVTAIHTMRAPGARGSVTLRSLGAWAAGAFATLVGILAAAELRGTSVAGVWFALYPFRIKAAEPIYGASAGDHLARLTQLTGLALLSLAPVILLALGVVAWRGRRSREPALTVFTPAVLAVATYDVFSVVAGRSYWSHYLVQLVVPTAIAAGILVAHTRTIGRVLTVASVGVSLLTWTVIGLTPSPATAGHVVGSAVARASVPGDTIVSALGDADVVEYSGLRSEYPYLWSLPARTLDTHFATLAGQLTGDAAPTWLVVRGPATSDLLMRATPGWLITSRYHQVATLCGRAVYLRDDVTRPTPMASARC